MPRFHETGPVNPGCQHTGNWIYGPKIQRKMWDWNRIIEYTFASMYISVKWDWFHDIPAIYRCLACIFILTCRDVAGDRNRNMENAPEIVAEWFEITFISIYISANQNSKLDINQLFNVSKHVVRLQLARNGWICRRFHKSPIIAHQVNFGLRCQQSDAKNSIYIDIIDTKQIDNRYGFSLSIGNTSNMYSHMNTLCRVWDYIHKKVENTHSKWPLFHDLTPNNGVK